MARKLLPPPEKVGESPCVASNMVLQRQKADEVIKGKVSSATSELSRVYGVFPPKVRVYTDARAYFEADTLMNVANCRAIERQPADRSENAASLEDASGKTDLGLLSRAFNVGLGVAGFVKKVEKMMPTGVSGRRRRADGENQGLWRVTVADGESSGDRTFFVTPERNGFVLVSELRGKELNSMGLLEASQRPGSLRLYYRPPFHELRELEVKSLLDATSNSGRGGYCVRATSPASDVDCLMWINPRLTASKLDSAVVSESTHAVLYKLEDALGQKIHSEVQESLDVIHNLLSPRSFGKSTAEYAVRQLRGQNLRPGAFGWTDMVAWEAGLHARNIFPDDAVLSNASVVFATERHDILSNDPRAVGKLKSFFDALAGRERQEPGYIARTAAERRLALRKNNLHANLSVITRFLYLNIYNPNSEIQ